MTALNPAGWRPEMNAGGADDTTTFTGNRALMLEEPLLFEIGSTGTTGVDFDEDAPAADLGALARSAPIGLPGLSESETVRHSRACRDRIMRSTSASSRSHAARCSIIRASMKRYPGFLPSPTSTPPSRHNPPRPPNRA